MAAAINRSEGADGRNYGQWPIWHWLPTLELPPLEALSRAAICYEGSPGIESSIVENWAARVFMKLLEENFGQASNIGLRDWTFPKRIRKSGLLALGIHKMKLVCHSMYLSDQIRSTYNRYFFCEGQGTVYIQQPFVKLSPKKDPFKAC